MVMLWIEDFDWDPRNVGHIARHEVQPHEVEDLFCNEPLVRRGGEDKYIAYGQTNAGRYVVVVFAYRGGGLARVITARNMDDKERRLYLRDRR